MKCSDENIFSRRFVVNICFQGKTPRLPSVLPPVLTNESTIKDWPTQPSQRKKFLQRKEILLADRRTHNPESVPADRISLPLCNKEGFPRAIVPAAELRDPLGVHARRCRDVVVDSERIAVDRCVAETVLREDQSRPVGVWRRGHHGGIQGCRTRPRSMIAIYNGRELIQRLDARCQ